MASVGTVVLAVASVVLFAVGSADGETGPLVAGVMCAVLALISLADLFQVSRRLRRGDLG